MGKCAAIPPLPPQQSVLSGCFPLAADINVWTMKAGTRYVRWIWSSITMNPAGTCAGVSHSGTTLMSRISIGGVGSSPKRTAERFGMLGKVRGEEEDCRW